jgi:hypothetical protein
MTSSTEDSFVDCGGQSSNTRLMFEQNWRRDYGKSSEMEPFPYSVCTQGHVARLSNVMIGFDDAFVPPVPVGEILQQKMAAIYGMDVSYEEQLRLANPF